jgi:hypothetical protein
MKYFTLLLVFISSMSFFIDCKSYALDAFTKLELRNSFRQFEKCMDKSSNDITECINEFNNAVVIYKDAFKKEPSNEDVQYKLLLLVNTMNDIGETYYSAAEKKKGIDPSLSQKYYEKASICYNQLIELYPSKEDFKDLLKKANYLSKYEEVEGYIFELNNRKRIDYALLTFKNLKSSHDSFIATFGRNEKLIKDVDHVIVQFANKLKHLFDTTVNRKDSEGIKSLIYLIEAQSEIADTCNKKDYRTTLAHMESEIIQIIDEMVKSYNSDLEKSEKDFNNEKFSEAEMGFKNLLSKTNLFPDYSSANQSLQIGISRATNNFNINQFRNDLQQKIHTAHEKKIIKANIERQKEEQKQSEQLFERQKEEQKQSEQLFEEFYKKHGFSTGVEFFYFVEELPDWEDLKGKFTEEGFTKRVETLYNDLDKLKLEHKPQIFKDFSWDDKNKYNKILNSGLVQRMGENRLYIDLDEVKNEISYYLSNIIRLEERKTKIREALEEIISKYKDSPKPKNFKKIKNLLSRIPNWKVSVAHVAVAGGGWQLSFFDYPLMEGEELVFKDIPMDASSYNKKTLIVKASINRKMNGYYVMQGSEDEEAIAEIPRELIIKNKLRLKSSYLLVSQLVDIIEVQTVIGGSKTIAKIKVDGIIDSSSYSKFKEYVLGHPEEFPQDRYVEIHM